MTSINNAWVELANGKILPYYGPDYEYEDLVIKVSMKERTPTIRSMNDDERNRAKERARINSHDAFMDFPPHKPTPTIEERLDAIEWVIEAMCDDLNVQHMLEVRKMREKSKMVEKDDSVVYDVKANYQ